MFPFGFEIFPLGVDWTQVLAYGPTAVLLALVLTTLIRLAPTWKEVKLREMDIRAEENKVREKEAGALAILGEALNGISETLNKISVEQKKATDEISIMQRVNADSNDRLTSEVRSLGERLTRFETTHPNEVSAATN